MKHAGLLLRNRERGIVSRARARLSFIVKCEAIVLLMLVSVGWLSD